MNFFNKLGLVGRASILLAVFHLLSRLIGLLRDRVLASRFGASDILDVYYTAFNIPDFVFNLLVVGAVSSAFIPIFIEKNQGSAFLGIQGRTLVDRKKEILESGQILASNFLNVLFIFVALAVVLLFFFVPSLVGLVAPGFAGPKKELAILFTRVMLLSPLIFSVSVVLGSVLQSLNRFLAYAFAPIAYNLGIIFGALVLEPKFGPLGLAEGVVLGAFLHLAVQASAVWRAGFKWKVVFDFTGEGMRKIFKLMLPRTIGLAAAQINTIVLYALASLMPAGAVAIYSFANNLQFVPIALVGISIATASFPTLSRKALAEDKKEFIGQLKQDLKRTIFLVVPFSILVFLFRNEIVRLILQAGQFSALNVLQTGRVLGFFTIGVWGQSVVPTLSRAFYALRDTKTPVALSIISVAVNILLAFYFVRFGSAGWQMGVEGLALAYSLAGILNALLLLAFLKRKIVRRPAD